MSQVTGLLCAIVALGPVGVPPEPDAELAAKARAVLQSHCYRCHGENGTNEGGFNFVLDRERVFIDRYNRELVDLHRLTPEHMEAYLKYLQEMLADFVVETGSDWGREVSENFVDLAHQFWLVKPRAADLGSLLDTLLKAA